MISLVDSIKIELRHLPIQIRTEASELGRHHGAHIACARCLFFHACHFGVLANLSRWREASVDPSLIAVSYHARA